MRHTHTYQALMALALALALSGCWDDKENPFGTLEAEFVSKDGGPSGDASSSDTQVATAGVDIDKDGVFADKDCDDKDSKVGAPQIFFRDEDGDGFPHSTTTYVACKKPEGYMAYVVGMVTDCDDGSEKINPKALEICDGIDNDCNGQKDDAKNAKWFMDADGDGRGDPGGLVEAGCKQPNKKLVANSDDCDDLNPKVFKDAPESCDGLDNDCDGQIDDGVKIPVYVDGDEDGFGDKVKQSLACKAEAGFATNGDDCNDGNAKVNPKAAETCNEVDDDCNGKTDEDVKKSWWVDIDGDTYGDGNAKVTLACEKPSGHAGQPGDCNDLNANVHPFAAEFCNKLDDDCDGQTDEYDGVFATDHKFFTQDLDGDGWAKKDAQSIKACQAPPTYGLVSASGGYDCNDLDKTVFEGAPEACDGKDNDCDGQTDEGAAAVSCDDNNSYTLDTCTNLLSCTTTTPEVCKNIKGCGHTELIATLTCTLPKDPTPVDGDVCSVGLFFSKGQDFGPLSVAKSKSVLKASELCSKLKAGEMLRVTSMAEYAESGSKWVGGEFVEVTEGPTASKVKGTPGDISKLNIGLEFNYVLSDFKICQ